MTEIKLFNQSLFNHIPQDSFIDMTAPILKN